MWNLFGKRAKFINNGKITSLECKECGHKIFTLHTEQKYFHILGIPFTSTGWSEYLTCDSCNQIHQKRNLSPKTKDDVKKSKIRSPKPLYHFSGLLILLFTLAVGFLGVHSSHANDIVDFKKTQLNLEHHNSR